MLTLSTVFRYLGIHSMETQRFIWTTKRHWTVVASRLDNASLLFLTVPRLCNSTSSSIQRQSTSIQLLQYEHTNARFCPWDILPCLAVQG